jgi:hypothetical protein
MFLKIQKSQLLSGQFKKIVATAKEVGVLPPEAQQWPNSSSGGCANYVPGDIRWLHKGRLKKQN